MALTEQHPMKVKHHWHFLVSHQNIKSVHEISAFLSLQVFQTFC